MYTAAAISTSPRGSLAQTTDSAPKRTGGSPGYGSPSQKSSFLLPSSAHTSSPNLGTPQFSTPDSKRKTVGGDRLSIDDSSSPSTSVMSPSSSIMTTSASSAVAPRQAPPRPKTTVPVEIPVRTTSPKTPHKGMRQSKSLDDVTAGSDDETNARKRSDAKSKAKANV